MKRGLVDGNDDIDDDIFKKGKMMKKTERGPIILGCPSRRLRDDDDREFFMGRLPEEMAFEVLLRLPLRSLHQCMCVSKHWCSLIRSPFFSQAYLSRCRGGILVCVPVLSDGKLLIRFYYSSIRVLEPEPFYCRLKLWVSPGLYKGITQVVNGFACVCERDRIFLCNLSTGEVRRLPDPLPVGDKCSYYFGYDPINKVYKLLRLNVHRTREKVKEAADYRQALGSYFFNQQYAHQARRAAAERKEAMHSSYRKLRCANAIRDSLWRDYNSDQFEGQILTVGGGGHDSDSSTWRRLQPPVGFGDDIPLMLDAKSLCFKGVLYWFNQLLGPDAGLISFHLGQEQFRLIKPPQELASLLTSDKPRLVQFRGRMALLSREKHSGRDPGGQLVVHVLEDGEGNSWSRHILPFPPGFGGFASWGTIPIGNLPTGQLLLINTVIGAKFPQHHANYLEQAYAYDSDNALFER